MTLKKKLSAAVFAIIGLILVVAGGSLIENVERGTYDVVQYPTGKMRAVMDTGPYAQLFASVSTWPTSDTFFFTSDLEGGRGDYSIKVQFRDGSFAGISGTTRVILPSSPEQAIEIMTEHNYKNFSDLEDRLIMPVVRAAFIRTANLMSAQESYSAKRADFINWTWDQVENGLFKTEEVVTEIPRQDDPTKMEKKRVRTIIYGKDGEPLREKNPLFGTGIKLSNFEVKSFEYDPIVVKQIADQQQNFMAIETAKAQAERAKQDAIKAEEEGKAEAAKAKWGQEKINAQEIAQAEKNKEVAELIASQQLEVSKLEKQAAEQTKQKEILIGEGEATRKKLVMNADGALELKLKAQVEIEKNWADAFARRAVPTTYIAGASSGAGSSSDVDSKLFQTLVNSKIAGDIANIKPNNKE
jgi:regulator of protease activity HflC (stomatin/prohibitin superfamily)